MKIGFLFCITLSSVFAQSDSTSLQLAQKEREFSQTAGVKGIKNAFLAYFDDNSVSFFPQPVNGKQAMAAESESPASLVWSPSFVEISASGDFGFTTGPSEYRAGGVADSSVYYGHFVSVWEKNGNGEWKVILDIGSGYPKEEKKAEQFAMKQLSSRDVKKFISADTERLQMIAADSALSVLAEAKGNNAAMHGFASEDVRVYRKGSFPGHGKKGGLELVKNEKPLRFNFYAGKISSAADLGFTFGIAVDAASDTSSYIRIWQKENEWKVVVDVLKPWPTKK